ncbi:MAG: hypothetical protein ACR2KE_08700 [Candidatus Nanopelagicales bacterium]
MTRLRLAATGAAIALVAVAVAGCSSALQPAADSSSPAASSSASQGGSSGVTGQLPEGWPTQVPAVPGFTVMSGSGSGDAFTAQFQAAGDQSKAVKDYAIYLQNNGWALDGNIPPGANGLWGFRAFGYSLTLLSTVFGDQTVVSMNIQPA